VPTGRAAAHHPALFLPRCHEARSHHAAQRRHLEPPRHPHHGRFPAPARLRRRESPSRPSDFRQLIPFTMSSYKFVNFGWDDAKAASLDPVGRLIYRSNLLGGDQRITNTGGGNTSSKIAEKDPLGGESVPVLWVKGSGGDLRTSTRENFSSLYQDRLI